MKFYYLIFIDAVAAGTRNDHSENEAKFITLVYLSMVMSFNLLILREMFYLFSSIRIEFIIESFGEGKLNTLINYLTIYLIPLLLFNYLMVIRKNRWKLIKEKYSAQDDLIIYVNNLAPESITSKMKNKSKSVNGILSFSYVAFSTLALLFKGLLYIIFN